MSPQEAVEKYANMVYRIAYARAGSKEDADDIFQEVFLYYLKKQPHFRDEEHAKAWFIRVSVNYSKKYMGKRSKKKELPMELSGEDGYLAQDAAQDGGFSSTEEKVLADERKDALYTEMEKLSSDARLLLHLFYFEDMSTAEIAKLLHKKETTVRVQMTRARQQLKRFFEEDGLTNQ